MFASIVVWNCYLQTEVPGVASKFWRKKIFLREKFEYPVLPQGTHGFPQKMSAHLVQLFGQLSLT